MNLTECVVETMSFVVLGIDPGKASGAAIVHATAADGEDLLWWGLVEDKPQHRDDVIELAKQHAIRLGVRLVVMLEAHTPGSSSGKWGHRTVTGLAQRRGAWIDAVLRAGVPRSRIVSVVPSHWRKVVVGTGSAPAGVMPGIVRVYVHTRFGWKRSNVNVREAVCIALCGACSPEAMAVLPKTKGRGSV